ncbi:MAG TPA: tetratricopeptide repeat protein [Polyangiaceae bacterium]|jgi:Tfp pilus assembly protein PilF|nr:tetratricopeptide repeat protein [Polyangiaceae bacterium]
MEYGRVIHRLAGVLSLAFLAALAGCGHREADSPVSQDVDPKSIAEYDVARDLWLQRHQPRQALDHALNAVQMDDENAEAAHMVALIYLDFCRMSPSECQLDQAARYARQALDVFPKYREARNTLGVILIHQRKYDEAISTLLPLSQDILYQTPENAWGNLGWAYLESGKVERAIDALQRAVAAQPAFCVGHYRLGQAFEKKGDPQEALIAYGRALNADQRCQGLQEAWGARGKLLMKLGRADDGRADLDECVRLDQSTETGRQCRAGLGKQP